MPQQHGFLEGLASWFRKTVLPSQLQLPGFVACIVCVRRPVNRIPACKQRKCSDECRLEGLRSVRPESADGVGVLARVLCPHVKANVACISGKFNRFGPRRGPPSVSAQPKLPADKRSLTYWGSQLIMPSRI